MANNYIAYNAENFLGKVVGNGQCVAFVEKAAYAVTTHSWKEGPKVKGNLLLQKGTAIATFQDGKYQNRTNGDSHAAIYLSQDSTGIWVLDQWKGQSVHKRHIRFNNAKGHSSNNADKYSVIIHD